ncbi:MAG TPA: GNAT family N-acetyltransferase [Pyrinomonadaceae bacterium]|nr:GNAT family N-acetyltransferase [Pyrinomonadaceae bacterium]
MINRILLFGDTFGLPIALKIIPARLIGALVGAEIRQHQHADLRRLAEAHNLPFLIQPKASSSTYPAFVERVRKIEPDLILVNSYSMLIRPEILALPPYGAINIHGALLPQYRGSNPTQWALINNESETGGTMHYMTADFDAGDIIARRRVPIYFEDTWLDIQGRLAEATEDLLRDELPKLLSQTNDRQPQDETRARHYRRRRPEDGLIDWQQSVLSIYNLVRALVKPHPGAFYYTDATKVVLDEALSIPSIAALKYGAEGGQKLESAQVRLIPISFESMQAALDLLHDNKPSVKFDNQASASRQFFEDLQSRSDEVVFGVRLLENDLMIGAGRLHNIDYSERRAELQIKFNPAVAHSEGLNNEVVRLLLDFAFEDINLDRICLRALRNDLATIKVYEKVGFTRQDVSLEVAHNKDEDVWIGIKREEYVGK